MHIFSLLCQLRHLDVDADKPSPTTPAPTAVCPYRAPSFVIPFLNLGVGAADRPSIDGYISQASDTLTPDATPSPWGGSEYINFRLIPMYNGGKNLDPGRTPQIGRAYVGYDCNNNILCVAAYLHKDSIDGTSSNCEVEELDSESWVRFTDNNGYTKLKESSANAQFDYIKYPDTQGKTIGKR